MSRALAIALIVTAAFFTLGSTNHAAQAQEVKAEEVDGIKMITNTYAAKFICGVQEKDDVNYVPDAQAGRYSSKINVHNNTGVPIRFRKKIIPLRGGEQPTGPGAKVLEALKPDDAMEVVCQDIYGHLKGILQPPSYIEGFVILEVYYYPSGEHAPPPDPLDVEGVYTCRGDFSKETNHGVSIDVVVYPAKSNSHVMWP